MATLLLSGLGSAIGGEFGGLVGAMLGRAIDGNLMGGSRSRAKEDLTVQTSSYGRQIPRIYGRLRVGGTVIWATDLQVQAGSAGTKYGATGTSYAANLAVALSSRTARGVRRIWADGKLLRGIEGDFKVPTSFRFYAGDEDQSADPLIASIEGVERTPAFRGLAVAVFEQLQLADFGNRIPFLTFEIEGDDEALPVNEILEDLTGQVASGPVPAPVVQGFAAFGEDVASSANALADAYGCKLVPDGTLHKARRVHVVATEEMGCSAGEQIGANDVRRQATATLPHQARVGFFDREVDLQASEQKVSWSTEQGPELRLDLPVSLTASEAKTLGQTVLARQWLKRERRTVRLPQKYLAARPGDRLVLPSDGEWLIDRMSVEELAVICECSRELSIPPSLEADGGRTIPIVDVPPAPSEVYLLDIPALGAASTVPSLLVGASGGSTPWRSLPVSLMTAGIDLARVAVSRRSIAGRSQTVLASSSFELLDRRNSILVTLAHDDWLESCTNDELLRGANLALLGDELIQFGEAEALGDRKFQLRRLLRGRFGTEWACSRHRPNERFLLLGRDDFQQVDLPATCLGSDLIGEGHGLGDTIKPSRSSLTYQGEALRPPTPVHLSVQRTTYGALTITWVRRSRSGYHWMDYTDAPLAEEREVYSVKVTAGNGIRQMTVSEPLCILTSGELEPVLGELATIEVIQLGSGLPSRPAFIQVRI